MEEIHSEPFPGGDIEEIHQKRVEEAQQLAKEAIEVWISAKTTVDKLVSTAGRPRKRMVVEIDLDDDDKPDPDASSSKCRRTP